MLPSGLINPKCINLVGSGVVIHVPSFFKELDDIVKKGLDCTGRLFVSSRAHIVFDFHQITDGLKERELSTSNKAIGTTGKGIGPTYSTKASRSGIRVHHLVSQQPGAWEEFTVRFKRLVDSRHKRYGDFEYDFDAELARYKDLAEKLRPYVVDNVAFMHKALVEKKKILIEGANALMLDLDFGTYPYVTSSNTSIGGVCTGLGIPPTQIKDIYGVVKAYTTRVGAGPFPTEQLNEVGEHLQDVGHEWGVTTGRKRRCGWLDLAVIKYSTLINGYTGLNITKLDILDQLPEVKVGIAYKFNGEVLESIPEDLYILEKVEVVYKTFPGWKADTSKARTFSDLPAGAQDYIKYIEEFVGVPVLWIGVGPARDAMITC